MVSLSLSSERVTIWAGQQFGVRLLKFWSDGRCGKAYRDICVTHGNLKSPHAADDVKLLKASYLANMSADGQREPTSDEFVSNARGMEPAIKCIDFSTRCQSKFYV